MWNSSCPCYCSNFLMFDLHMLVDGLETYLRNIGVCSSLVINNIPKFMFMWGTRYEELIVFKKERVGCHRHVAQLLVYFNRNIIWVGNIITFISTTSNRKVCLQGSIQSNMVAPLRCDVELGNGGGGDYSNKLGYFFNVNIDCMRC